MVKDKNKVKGKERRLTGGLYWNPTLGDELVGVLVAIREGNYTRNIYDIKTEKGIITIPSSAVLEGVLNTDLLDKKVRIKFLGWGKDKLPVRQPGMYRNFDVFLIGEE